jgi:amphiphysin
MRLTPL